MEMEFVGDPGGRRLRHAAQRLGSQRGKESRDYNVIFRDESGTATDAQLLAFED